MQGAEQDQRGVTSFEQEAAGKAKFIQEQKAMTGKHLVP